MKHDTSYYIWKPHYNSKNKEFDWVLLKLETNYYYKIWKSVNSRFKSKFQTILSVLFSKIFENVIQRVNF